MINEMVLQGRLVRDPELRNTQSGISCCSFTVAWSEKYKDKDDTQLFLDCTAWRGTGEMVSKYFTKGKQIIVQGKLHTENYEDKNGNKRSATKMTVDKVHFCGDKKDSDGGMDCPVDDAPKTPTPTDFADVPGDDDLPF